jgi:hypothetical protein
LGAAGEKVSVAEYVRRAVSARLAAGEKSAEVKEVVKEVVRAPDRPVAQSPNPFAYVLDRSPVLDELKAQLNLKTGAEVLAGASATPPEIGKEPVVVEEEETRRCVWRTGPKQPACRRVDDNREWTAPDGKVYVFCQYHYSEAEQIREA